MKGWLFSWKVLVFLTIVFAFSYCKNDPLEDCFKSTGGDATERRFVDDFTDISVYNNPNVVITQDTVNSIVVEAGDHLLSEIKTTVSGGQLKIENDNTCNWVRSYKRQIYIYVHVKNLKSVTHYGSGNITCTNTITAVDFLASNHTSGDITLTVNATRTYAQTHTAAGDVTISGTTDELYAYDICQGIVHCENLVARSVYAACKNTGNCYVNATSYLSSEIRGDGNIYYYGNPVITQNINTGSGELVHLP